MLRKQQAHAVMGEVQNGPNSVILSKTPLTTVHVLNQVLQVLNFTPNGDRLTSLQPRKI